MEIKAGDKVRIKSWEKLLEENSDSYDVDYDELERGPGFVKEMREFCGKELHADNAWNYREEDDKTYVWFEQVGGSYTFSSWMVEEVISNEL